MSNPIVTENANQGSVLWVPTSNAATTQIQAYCDKVSYSPSDTVTFYVSVQVNGTAYTVRIFRMGWYGGTGACLKSTSTSQTGVAQGYYDSAAFTLNSCPTAVIDGTTGRVEAGWASSYTWSIPSDAVTGIYLAQLTDANGKQTYVRFTVKNSAAADYLYVYADTTDAAYNEWGVKSLYHGADQTVASRAYKVSLNRPIADVRGFGAGNLFYFNEVCLIRWLEKNGYNVSYVSDIDVHVTGASLFANVKAAIFGSHDEYWTFETRAAVETALTQGVGLAFTGADAVYWQCRMEADSTSVANRTVTCYKVGTDSNTSDTPLSTDPEYGVDNTRVSTLWRDACLNRPEAALIGIQFSAITLSRLNVGWTVDSGAGSLPYLDGTGLVPGATYGQDIVGVEYDKQAASSPANLKLLGTTSLTNASNQADTANTSYYVAPSGALVFAAGSIAWCQALDWLRIRNSFTAPSREVPGIQAMMAHIMAGLIAAKGGSAVTRSMSSLGFHG